jgi:hypothetical protein
MSQNNLVLMILQNYQLFRAEQDCKLPLKLSLIGLRGCSDEHGLFHWLPRHLKLKVLPYDEEVDFEKVLNVLMEQGFIGKHEEQGKIYGYVLPNNFY